MRSSYVQILVAAAAVGAIFQSPRARGQTQSPSDTEKPPASQAKVTISKETTYITEPLRKDGYPDYIRYVDEKLRQGVTPNNNAVVLLLRALGPREISEKHREAFCKRLGIEPLPAKGDYFIDWSTFSQRFSAKDWPAVPPSDRRNAREYFEELDGEAGARPWTREDLPQLAQWLDANDKFIDQFVAASKRSRRYAPPLVDDEHEQTLVSVLLPIPQNERLAARALVARAMYRAGKNDIDGAIGDLVACHRLARLAGQGFAMVEGLVAIAMDHIAIDAEAALIAADKLTAKQRSALRKELEQLKPIRRMVDMLDQGERLMYMDSVCWISREGASALRQLMAFSDSRGKAQPVLDLLGNLTVDWNVPLKIGNQWYDRYVETARIEDAKQRLEGLAAIERDLKSAASQITSASAALDAIFSPRQTASKQMANVFVALLLPALNAALQAEHRNQAKHSLVKLGLALADYRDEHKQFPEKLDDLAPKYIHKIPVDPMWGEPLVYRKTADGYTLYTLGKNGRDDGGRTENESDDADDLVIAVPRKKGTDK